MRILRTALFMIVAAATSLATAESTTDASDIVRRANLAYYYAGADGRAEARMKIVDAQGRTQLRQFTMLRRDQSQGGNQDMLVFFSRPSDVRGTVFRVVRQPGNEDDRWLYLPGLDLVKRISAGDKRTSFVGSDFFYEDVSGRDPNADRHTLLETTDKFYVLTSIPKDSESVEFASYQSWINRETLLPEKVEFTNSKGQLYRQMEVLKTDSIQGYPVVLQAKISNLARGTSTLMQMRGIRFDLGLPEGIFSERSLRTPPTQWLRKK